MPRFKTQHSFIIISVEEIHFYVHCNEQLHYADYIEKCVAGKMCTISFKFNAATLEQLKREH